MTAIKTDIDAQPEACLLPFGPVGQNTATNVQDAIALASQIGGGWSVQTTSAGGAMVDGALYVVSGASGDVPLTLPASPAVGERVAVYMEDYSSTQTATVDAGAGYTIGAAGMGAQTHQLGGQGAYCVYQYIGGSVWATEQPQITRQIRYKSSSLTLNKIFDNSVIYIDSSSARTVTVPSEAACFLPVGYQTDIIRFGTGSLTLVADSGVTITTSSPLVFPAQGSRGVLTKIDADVWSWQLLGGAFDTITFDIQGDRQGGAGLASSAWLGAIGPGLKGFIEIPYACTITAASLLADAAGSIVVDIWKAPYASLPPVIGGSIVASAPPTLTSAVSSRDTTLTGWTTAIAAGDWLAFNINSASVVKRVTLSLTVAKA